MKQIQTTFQDLIERSYQAIKKRGLIDENTKNINFVRKMQEETSEVTLAHFTESYGQYISEVVQLATVCIMQIKHLGYNFQDEFIKEIEKNESRAKDEK